MMPPRAYFFIGLNAVRALSIISLLLVFASSIFVMATNIKAVNAFEAAKQSSNSTEIVDTMLDCDYIEGSTVPNQPAGVFWAVVASLLITFQVVILLLSEIGWPAKFFDRYFPVLGPNFGLGALGIFQCLIGAQILSHHVDDFTLVSAFLLFSLGCLNMLLGLIFRERAKTKRSITSWREEAKGILPTSRDNRPVFVNATPQFVSTMFTGNSAASNEKQGYSHGEEKADYETWRSAGSDKAGYGFGRQGEKAAGLRGFILQKPAESLPRYAPPPPSSHKSRPSSAARSSTSSFASPSQPQSPTLDVPVFKSSSTAL